VLTRLAGTVAVVLVQVQVQLRVAPVPLWVHTQDCFTLVALAVEDYSSRMTIRRGCANTAP
jgi:hypothetical protein